ncbi:MAG: hypothetical protein AAF570_22900 [Bacteroidota bacterium]
MMNAMRAFDKMNGTEHSEAWYKAMAWTGLGGTTPHTEFFKTPEGEEIKRIQENETLYARWRKGQLMLEHEGESMPADEYEKWANLVAVLEDMIDWELVEGSRVGSDAPLRETRVRQ